MTDLDYHEHECSECGQRTTHHTFDHEDQGDEVEFWCSHCEKDVTGKIRRFVA